jgi:alanine racemase
VDTGMGRSGVWDRDAMALVDRLLELQGLTLDGIFTHFSSSDEPDRSHTERQLDRFDAVLRELEARNIRPPRVHVANSAAALRFGRAARALVRPGIALYGAVGEFAEVDPDAVRPILSWHARVVAVKELAPGDSVSYHRRHVAGVPERIAVLGVGYADGWPFGLSDGGAGGSGGRGPGGDVLIRGRSVPIRGAVCMDLTMVDATPFPDLVEGEVATLIGGDGDARRTVEDVGRRAGLMSYAVLTGIGSRVRRRYITSAEGSQTS